MIYENLLAEAAGLDTERCCKIQLLCGFLEVQGP